MSRIRSIKPEFWTSEQVVECSPTARLLFIGFWNFADDNGVLPASAKHIKMLVYPGDDFTVSQVMGFIEELICQGLLAEFEGPDGRKYWAVTGWKAHQKIEKPSYKYPAPPSKFDDHSTTIRRPFSDSSVTERKGEDRIGEDRRGVERSGSTPSAFAPSEKSLEALDDRSAKVEARKTAVSPEDAETSPLNAVVAVMDADGISGTNHDESTAITPEDAETQRGTPPPDRAAREGDGQAIVRLPLNDGTERVVTMNEFVEYERLYPSVDVLGQLRAMRGWLLSNPQRRKTKRGIMKFVNSWLNDKQNKAPPQRASPQVFPYKTNSADTLQARNIAVLQEWLDQGVKP